MGQGVGELNVSVTARTGKARSELGGLAADVRKLPRAARDAQAGLGGLGRGLDRTGVASGLAQMGLAKLVGVAGGAVATFLTLRAGIHGVAHAMSALDNLGKTADKLSVDPRKLAGLRLAAEEAGIASSKFDTSLGQMVRRVSEATEGTGEAAGALRELGLSANSLNSLAPDRQFRTIAEALKGVANPANQARIAYDLFGRSGIDLLNVLRKDSAALDEAQRAAEKLGIAVDRKSIAAVEAANDALGRMKKSGEGLANSLAVLVAPAVENTAWFFSELASEASGGLQALGIMDDVNEAAMEAERAAKQAAAAEAERIKVRESLNKSYRDEVKALRELIRESERGGEQTQLDRDKKKYGDFRAWELMELRDQAALAKEAAAEEEKLFALRREVAEFNKSDAEKRRSPLADNAVTLAHRAEAKKLYDELERLEKDKEAKEKAREARKRDKDAIKTLGERVAEIGKSPLEAERERTLAGIADSKLREQAVALFDKLAAEEQRKSAADRAAQADETRRNRTNGFLDASSSEGYAALRANLRGDSIATQTLAEQRRQTEVLQEMAAGIDDLAARSFFEDVYSLN